EAGANSPRCHGSAGLTMFNRPLDPKLLSVFLTVWLGLLAAWDLEDLRLYVLHEGPVYTDFFHIWNWARFEIERPPAMIYDAEALDAFLRSSDPLYPVRMAFPYPPLYLLIIRPLASLSYPLAHIIWSGSSLLAYMVAVCSPAWRPHTAVLALLAPTTAL